MLISANQLTVSKNERANCDSGLFENLHNIFIIFLSSNFRCFSNAACFLLVNSPAFELYMPMFRNTSSVPSSREGRHEDGTDRMFRNVGI